MEKSRYARFSFLYMHNRTYYYVHVNNDLYMEQMNHSVVIKLKINNFMLTFTGISRCFKKQISPRNTAEFHCENRIFAAKKTD